MDTNSTKPGNWSFRACIPFVVCVLLVSSCGRQQKSEDPAAFASGWYLHKTEHFALMDPPDSPRAEHMHAMGDACEEIYQQLKVALGVDVTEPIWIYRFVTSSECLAQSGHPAGTVSGHRIYTRIGAPLGGVIALAACESIVPGHQAFAMLRDGIREAFDNQTSNVHHDASLLRAEGAWISLSDLITATEATDRRAYNTEAASFAAYIIQRHGAARFKELWQSSGELAPALERIFGGTIGQMEEDWIAHLEREANRT